MKILVCMVVLIIIGVMLLPIIEIKTETDTSTLDKIQYIEYDDYYQQNAMHSITRYYGGHNYEQKL